MTQFLKRKNLLSQVHKRSPSLKTYSKYVISISFTSLSTMICGPICVKKTKIQEFQFSFGEIFF